MKFIGKYSAHLIRACLFFLLSIVSTSASTVEALNIDVGDASTRVMFCKVNLKVSDFVITNTKATGRYTIKVPAASWKDESGTIELTVEDSLTQLRRMGGKLEGITQKDTQDKDNPIQNKLTCIVTPQTEGAPKGELSLTITTAHRVLKFDTHYTVMDAD